MKNTSPITITIGIVLLIFSVINGFTSNNVEPSLQRAEIVATLSSVFIIVIGILWSYIEPKPSNKKELIGDNGFYLDELFNDSIKEELAWGSHQILIATAASTLLVYWSNNIILRRGLISTNDFIPGKICMQTKINQKLMYLPNTKNYPGSFEFDNIIKELPSIIIYPLKERGFVVIGGWSERCFTKSDELWIKGWSERLLQKLEQ